MSTENTPLLQGTTTEDRESASLSRAHGAHISPPPARASLPMAQIGVLLLIALCEPISATIVFPFVAQFVNEVGITHGDTKATGYYVGLIESFFFLAQGFSVLHWGRLSDRIGRKPVLLTGLIGLSLSILSFGLSRTFWGMVLARSIAGFLNGNGGVIKTMMAELTAGNEHSRGVAFSWLPVTWLSGSTIAPLIGGSLQHPAERFPKIFGGSKFWKTYPYFLPSCAAASFSAIGWISALFLLKETLPSKVAQSNLKGKDKCIPLPQEDPVLVPHHPSGQFDLPDDADAGVPTLDGAQHKLVPLRSVLNRRVVIGIVNYAALAVLDISFFATLTLFLAVPISSGGLGLSPQKIGVILGAFGLISGVTQLSLFPLISKRVSRKRLFMVSLAAFFIIWPAMGAMHFLADRSTRRTPETLDTLPESSDFTWWVWVVLALQLGASAILDMGYATIFVEITQAAPSPSSLGTINGLSQTLVSFVRALGPAGATSLFSLSVEKGGVRGSYVVYAGYTAMVVSAIAVATLLPQEERVGENEQVTP